jgi:hypothetical protein
MPPHTAGLFRHATRPITFCLVVDDFGVKYEGVENAQHLINTLQKAYTITIDWEGQTYLGMKLTWDYNQHWVDLSMPNYVDKALQRFAHPTPNKPPQDAPYGQNLYNTERPPS